MMNYGMGNPYNPMLTAQQRLAQMEQQYPQYAQMPIPQQPKQTLMTIPVTSPDEAKAFMVDTNGTPTFFYNAGANEIYLKRTNLQTGSADFFIFRLQERPRTDVKTEKGVNTYKEDFKALNDKIDGLYSLLGQPVEEPKTKGAKNAK